MSSAEKEAGLEAQSQVHRRTSNLTIIYTCCAFLLIYLYVSLVGPYDVLTPCKTFLDYGTSTVDLEAISALNVKFTPENVFDEALFIENPSYETLNSSLYQYTKHPHLAGNLALARYTRDTWRSLGIEDVEIVQYEVLLNYPTNSSQVSLIEHDQTTWHATLREDVLPEDPGSAEAIPFFHGYSKNGSALGQLIYVNYGRPEDYEAVLAAGVNLKGKIAIARYGRLFRGLKVELAQRHHMSAVLLYDDPSEDHGVTEEEGYKPYPHGPARNPSSVQRGSVQFLSVLPGDPTTPGYPSLPGCERQDPYTSTPSIPSIPISMKDAAYLLKTLNGQGPSLKGFAGALPGIKYNVGDSKSKFTISLDNVVDYDYRPIYNVIAKIPGHFDDTIILGNHRDAWVRGASDPSSGSTALDSIVGTFAALQRDGYVPLRSLVFASWDAEEYGLVGSTEWVEEHATELSKNAIAYLNVDVASSGQDFSVSASPLLFSAILNATERVPGVLSGGRVPGTPGVPSQSLRSEISGHIRTLGSGSDYTAFQDALGITSSDFGFQSDDRSKGVYHYHSQYDSFHWLSNYGDPGLKSLAASTRLWGLLAYRLAESPVIAFNASLYGSELKRYIKEISADHKQKSLKAEWHKLDHITKEIERYGEKLDRKAAKANAKVKRWAELDQYDKLKLLRKIHHLNEEYKQFERSLLDPKGLPDRPFFKHILYAPGRWTGYAGAIFPSITESTPKTIKHAVRRIIKILKDIGHH